MNPLLYQFRIQGDNPVIFITTVRAIIDSGERGIDGKISTTRGGFAAYDGQDSAKDNAHATCMFRSEGCLDLDLK
jgi:hypothetical protein